MQYIFFSSFISILIILVGIWLFVSTRYYQNYLTQKANQINLEQKLHRIKQVLANEQNMRKQIELTLHERECEKLNLFSKLVIAEERLNSLAYYQDKCEKINKDLQLQRDINHNQEIELREVSIRLEETRLAAVEKQRVLISSEQRLLTQFETLANRIFQHNGRMVDEQNQQSLNQLLVPLRDQLEGFRRQIQESFNQEARERHTLTYEIRNLQQLNSQITQETVNLTRALKGDNKVQGKWGEIVLSKILEASGLREGYEFETKISMQQEDGRRLLPDVIVRLPQEKDVVIDAKISLVAYERYCNSNNQTDRQVALTEHINSLLTHIKLLSRKNYQQLLGLRSLNYVLMFVPIEPAFITAISRQPELISKALAYNIMLVSPTTLLVALRTIHNLWRYEHQSNNALHIADRAARLYDKLRLFIDDINTIGQRLNEAQTSYQLAKNKLSDGRGNIISQAESFRALGVEIKRPIVS